MTSLRVLCLHGYRQNGTIFREKTGSLRKLLKKQVAEFVYVDAPHVIPVPDTAEISETNAHESLSRTNERGWWFSSDDQSYDPLVKTSCDRGFNESLDFIVRFIDEQDRPFDGLLAFSQGAAFATLLLAHWTKRKVPFRFVILVAPFASGQHQHQSFYESLRIDLPTLHVIGTNDRVIPCEISEHLSQQYFTRAQIFRHDGGHFIPAHTDAKQIYQKFLEEFCEE